MDDVSQTSTASQPKVLSKHGRILANLRRQIVQGRLQPGSRLPTYNQMESQFSVSRATLQQVVSRLKREGFIYSAGRRGTFVSETPPHLCRYALVFPSQQYHPFRTRFWTAMTNEAAAIGQSAALQVPLYQGVDAHADNEVYQQLLRDAGAHRLAGVIFVENPTYLANTPLLEDVSLPKVAFSRIGLPGVWSVAPDNRSFVDRALDWLASRGRKRIAVLSQPQHPNFHDYTAAITQRGMTTGPYWQLSMGEDSIAGARNLIHLLMRPGSAERPDGLVIADDNFVEHASSGLIAAGARIPEDLDVVAHCNWPWPVPSVLPVQRLGFDTRRLLRLAIDTIDAVRRGEQPPARQTIPCVFEEELNDNATNAG